MIPNQLKPLLRTKVTFNAIVSDVKYKGERIDKILLRKVRINDFIVINHLTIPYKSNIVIRKNQKIKFNAYLMPSILKDENKKEYVGVKVKNISALKEFN